MDMDDRTVQQHLCLTRVQFNYLSQKLGQQGLNDDHRPGGPPNIPVTNNIVMFLWYLCNQNSFRELSDKFDVSQGGAHNVILEMLELTCALAASFITWPTECEKRTNAGVFRRVCGMNGIIGAIDGCLIKIQIRGGDYLNRNHFYSVLLQGIVDDQGTSQDLRAKLVIPDCSWRNGGGINGELQTAWLLCLQVTTFLLLLLQSETMEP